MMAKISKNIVVLAIVVLCTLFLAGHSVGPVAKAQTKQAEQIEDPYKHSRILVEAFVVEVKLSMLYELGVSPIGQTPNSVSIEDILQCLRDTANAKVTAGAKVAVIQNQEGRTQATETVYVERQTTTGVRRENRAPTASKTFQSYDVSKIFTVRPMVIPDGKIVLTFDFSQNTLGSRLSQSEAPPDLIRQSWSGTISLNAGKPSLVGATQNEETAAFLIICADIKSQ